MDTHGPTPFAPLPVGVEGIVTLRDGTPVRIRVARPEDRAHLLAFLERLSDQSLARRFFAAVSPAAVVGALPQRGPPEARLALVVVPADPSDPRILAHAEYDRDGPAALVAEVAFLVAGSHRGRGCATLLLDRLARADTRYGIREFRAQVMEENDEMLEVVRDSGFPLESRFAEGVLTVELRIAEGSAIARDEGSAPPIAPSATDDHSTVPSASREVVAVASATR